MEIIKENEKKQSEFLKTTLGSVINIALDAGIEYLLPNIIDDQVINIKNNLLENGLKEGINKTVEDAIKIGKAVIGIFNKDFQNIDQLKILIKKGGILEGMSEAIDSAVKLGVDKNMVNGTVAKIIAEGKNTILSIMEKDINKEIEMQSDIFNKINNNINNWNEAYKDKNMNLMKEEYAKITEEIQSLLPLENILERYNEIKNIQILIENNGNNFDLSNEELEIIKKI